MMSAKMGTVNDEDMIRMAFRVLDKDGDGTISVNELGALFKCFGAKKSVTELEQILLKYDDDGSGEIEFDEFKTLLENDGEHPEIDAFKSWF